MSQVCSTWDELASNDIVGRLKPLLKNGILYLDRDTQKITRSQVLHTDSPWIFVRRPEWLHCDLWHNVYFRCMKIIHSKCFECYKVVARPRTLKELFAVYNRMVELNIPSKAGIEQRPYVRSLYGCYFYCNGIEEGKIVHSIVKGALNDVAPGLDVILKRGCTEFELVHGDSSKYEQKPEHAHWETLLAEHFDDTEDTVEQPEFLKNHIKLLWIAHAYQNNDPTVLEFTGGKDLFEKPRTYHEEG